MKESLDFNFITFPMIPSDFVGRIFHFEGRLFRAIYDSSTEYVQALLESGLIKELEEKGFFPKTTISNYELPGFPLILEHKKIRTLSYPYEWSFEMLKDAAIRTLEVAVIANKYGYELHDGHASNIMFENNTPIFIDLGSFVKKEAGGKWGEYIFESQFELPLKLWAKGYYGPAKTIFLLRDYVNINEYKRLLYQPRYNKTSLKVIEKLAKVRQIDESTLAKRINNRFFYFVLLFIKKYLLANQIDKQKKSKK